MIDVPAKLRRLLAPLTLAALAVVVFLPALHGTALWDDRSSLFGNPYLHRADGLWTIWTTTDRMPSEEHYWPMTYTVLWLEARLWGDWPTGFHLVNFLLHAAIVVQIWRLMRRIGLRGAWPAAALFAVHPVHAESVAWIMSVKDLLAMLFCLLAVEAFLRHEERGGGKWLAAAAAANLAALLSKSSAIALPAAYAILVWYRRGRFDRRDLTRLAVTAAVTAVMAAVDFGVVKQNLVGHHLVVPPLLNRLVQAGMAFGFYAGKLAWPARLSPVYPQFEFQVSNAVHWLPLAATVLVSVLLWIARERLGRGPLACWLFYGAALGPTLGIVYFGFLMKSPVADRYQYFASLGPIAGVGALVAAWVDAAPRRSRALRSAPAAAALLALGAASWQQARYYKNEIVYFSHALEIAPESAVAYYNLGVAWWNQNQYKPAEYMFAKAHQYDPADGDAIYNLGRAMARQGRTAEAVTFYREQIAAGCVHPNVWGSLAWLLAVNPEVRDPRGALRLATEANARSAQPDAELMNALAAALAANGHFVEAASTARRALDLAKRGGAAETIRKIEKAIPLYEQGKPFVAAP